MLFNFHGQLPPKRRKIIVYSTDFHMKKAKAVQKKPYYIDDVKNLQIFANVALGSYLNNWPNSEHSNAPETIYVPSLNYFTFFRTSSNIVI